jgi:hypothetical protein
VKRFDIRKLRKLAAAERYSELYFHWHRAERMIASSLPAARRYGLRLKKRVENLYAEWFGPVSDRGDSIEGLTLKTDVVGSASSAVVRVLAPIKPDQEHAARAYFPTVAVEAAGAGR